MTIADFQSLIRDIYFDKDNGRGLDGTFMWFVEEVGELSRALKRGTPEQQAEEFADVLAWLTTMASIQGIDLEAAAARKYEAGCPKCSRTPCQC
jgi:NTP pyrophosphatase (non-canonical NTP hydrolase)